VIVLLAIVIAAGIVAAMAAVTTDGRQPALRAWVSRRFSRHPRVADFFCDRLDRTRAGGLLLTIGFIGLVVTIAFVTVVFDAVSEGDGLATLDQSVAQYGVDHGDSTIFDLYQAFTHLGGTQVVIIVAAVVAAWGWWRYRNGHVAAFVVTVVAGQAFVNNGLKWLVDRDRPDLNQLADWSGSSFPSGHSAAAAATWAAVAFVLTLHSGRIARTLAATVAAGIAAGVAATRALLGVHWFTDVVAGLSVGFGWFLICAVVFGGRIMRFGQPQDEAQHAHDLESLSKGA
jgi:undecaprenyl-diphosphatase